MAENKIINDFPGLTAKQCWTKGPGRFSEASLTGTLDKLEILRPSMAASITKILLDRKYVTIEKGSLTVTPLGICVVEFLVASGFEFMETSYTAELEKELDEISDGKNDRVSVLTKFYNSLKDSIDKANQVKKDNEKSEFKCPLCGGFLLLKHSSWGKFYSCQNYKKDTGCKYTANVGENNEPVEKTPKEPAKESDIKCPHCKEKFLIKTSKKGNEYLSCRNWAKNKSCKGFYDFKTGTKMDFSKKKFFKKK